jgi:putative ABC transport system substrate-binding protein
VASLARPGGNVTGTTFLGPELVSKRFELLREALPTAARVAILWHPGAFGEQTMREMVKEAEASARALGLQLRLVEVRAPGELDRAFTTIAGERADVVFVFPSAMLFNERKRLVALAARHRVPLLGNAREFAELGGFASYGAPVLDGHRRGAAHVDRILKGARPGDLPVEQPTTFELVINLKTAKALGLTIPPALRLRADQVIE